MTIDELYKNPIFIFPKERGNKTFKEFLGEKLNEYKNLIKELDGNNQICVPDINKICDGLSETVRHASIGLRCEAYCQLGKILSQIVTDRQHALMQMNIPMYRIRTFNDTTKIPQDDNDLMKELFHIPFNQVENVGNERYSLSGHPSLYLGNSIYTCCKELGITEHDIKNKSIYCSRFKRNDTSNGEPIQLFDLRINQRESMCMSENGKWIYLNVFPLILACSITVKEKNKPFKPEYIIPQLVLEWIRNNAHEKMDEKIRGIAYSSTKVTMNDVDCCEMFYNVVLPAGILSEQNTYCERLRSILEITTPVKLSDCINSENGNFDIDIDNQNKPHENCRLKQVQRYSSTIYGTMEEIVDKENFKTIDL
jgi:hypothetical protein